MAAVAAAAFIRGAAIADPGTAIGWVWDDGAGVFHVPAPRPSLALLHDRLHDWFTTTV